MLRKKLRYFSLLPTALIFASCASLPHNDVLIFGTETTLALDVGASATNGGTPEITIGYKRDEAVWMPLLANGSNTENKPTAGTLYQGASSGEQNKDAYSVFASFGAQLEGNAGSAKVGLAQFFATGIAAQRLAANPASVLALTVKSPEQGKADAEAVAEVAKSEASNTIAEKEKSISVKVFNCMLTHGKGRFATPPPGLNTIDARDYPISLSAVSSSEDVQAMIRNFPGFDDSAKNTSNSLGCPT